MTTPDQRRARRAWIAEHHPDRGGDPATFMTGLAGFPGDDGHGRPDPGVDHRPSVVRTAGAARAAKRAWRRVATARRRHTHHGIIE